MPSPDFAGICLILMYLLQNQLRPVWTGFLRFFAILVRGPWFLKLSGTGLVRSSSLEGLRTGTGPDLEALISPAYTEIKNVRAMLTSFAVQVMKEKLIREAKAAVLPSNRLHASSIKKSSHQVQWTDIGAATTERVAEIIQEHQPITWHFLHSIAKPESRGEGPNSGVRRPVSVVRFLQSVRIPSSLIFL